MFSDSCLSLFAVEECTVSLLVTKQGNFVYSVHREGKELV